jgi:hypothetical protein
MPVVAEEVSVKQEMDGADVAMATLARHNVATPNQAMTPQSVQPSPTMAQIQHALQRAINPDQSVAAYAQHLQSEASMVRAFCKPCRFCSRSDVLLAVELNSLPSLVVSLRLVLKQDDKTPWCPAAVLPIANQIYGDRQQLA